MVQNLKILLFLIFFGCLKQGLAQDNCYQNFYRKGVQAIENEAFESAINNFKAAKVCADKPSNNDVDEKIVDAQNGFINAIQRERKRAQSLALTAKSILELQKNDNPTTAIKYAQYALEKDDNSESRTAFYEAAYQLEAEDKRLLYSKSFIGNDKIYEEFRQVEFSQGGNYITVLTSDWMAKIFDLEGKQIASKKAYNVPFGSNSFSPDDKQVSFIGKDGMVYNYDFPLEDNQSGRTRFKKHNESEHIQTTAFSPGGNFFAVAYRDGLTRLHQEKNGKSIDLEGFGRRIESLSFSEDDSLLVTGNDKGGICIWNTDGSLKDTIAIQKYYDTEVLISPDKKHILATTSRQRARVFTIDGKEIIRTRGYLRKLTPDNFSPKGDYVAIGNEIYTLKDGASYGKLIQTLPDWVRNIRFSPKHNYILAVGYERTAQIWRRGYNEWEPYGTLGGHTDHIATAAISPDGKMVVTASYDKTIKLWPINTSIADGYFNAGKLLQVVTLNDTTTAITHEGKNIHLYNAKIGYNGYYGMPVEEIIAMSNDGKSLLTIENEMSNIWNFDPTGEGINFLSGVSAFHPIRIAKFSNQKKALVKFQEDDLFLSTSVWDIENQKFRALGGGHGKVSSLEWSADDKLIFVGNYRGEVIAWSYKSPLSEMEIFKRWDAHERQTVSSIAASSDGALIATASWDNTVKIWNKNFEHILTLIGHTMEINSVAFSPDNQFIITASEDRSAKIWDTKGQLIVSLEGYKSDVKSARFSPKMDYVVTNYGDGMIKIWPFEPALILDRIKQFSSIDLEEKVKEKYGIK